MNNFIGITTLTWFNKNNPYRNYWSKDPVCSVKYYSPAIACNKFKEIKSRLKYSKAKDPDLIYNAKKIQPLKINCQSAHLVLANLLQPFFNITPAGKISQFRLYFDNFFSSLDLIVHFKNLGLKCTGTIREIGLRKIM